MNNLDVYSKVTEKLVATLKRGVVPWTAPYVGEGLPRNASSGRRYSGINVWVAMVESMINGYTSCGWVTFKQAIDAGCVVRRHQKATTILFMKKVTPKRKPGEEERSFFTARSYSVFNLDQLTDLQEGSGALARLRADTDVEFQHDPVAECETMITATGAVIKTVRGTPVLPAIPAYVPGLDHIEMPARNKFVSKERYYATLFHELVHWTGHKSRLDRDLDTRFGNPQYASEELVAELGAAMLAHRFGFDVVTYSAQYLSTWLDAIHENPSFLVACASAASKAVEFLLPTPVLSEEDANEEEAA